MGSAITLADRTGDSLSITLNQVVDPDTADNTVGYDACPQTGYRLVLVRLTLHNVGTSILSGEVGTDLWLVDKNGAATASDGACDFGNATSISGVQHSGLPIASPLCGTSITSPNLPPGGSAVVCRVTQFPIADTVAAIELRNPMNDTLLANFSSTPVWYITPPS